MYSSKLLHIEPRSHYRDVCGEKTIDYDDLVTTNFSMNELQQTTNPLAFLPRLRDSLPFAEKVVTV